VSAGTIQLVIALTGTAFLVVVLAAGIVYCVRSAKENGRASRDAGVRAGDYPIPYVIHFRGLAAGLAIVLGVGVILAGVGFWLDAVSGYIVTCFVLLGVAFIVVMSRYRLTLGPDDLRTREFLSERVIRYADVARVDPYWASAGGRGVLIKLRVHFADGSKPIDLNLTYVPPRERAVIVDRLQRKAINATFSPELHALWTGAF